MSGNRVLIDTNIILYFLKGEKEVIDMISDKDLVISFISELELLSFPDITSSSLKIIKGFLSNCLIFNINNEIKELTIELRKKSRLKLPDAIIAATSLYYKLPLLTADKQFRKVQALDIIEYEV